MALYARPPAALHEPQSIPTEQYIMIFIHNDAKLMSGSAFSPYSDNGGTILAIAGKDFSVIAGDTRQSEGYSIQTRYARKVWQL